MANKTIGELPSVSLPATGAEIAHVVQGGNSRQIALNKLPVSDPVAELLAVLLPPRFVQGLILANNATDATNDIDIGAGMARGNGVVATNGGTLVKRLDAAWVEGTNQGGLDTGSKANSTTYHVHAIRKNSDGAFDALFSLSAIAPIVPSGWTLVERLGAVLTDGTGVIRSFWQNGNRFSLVGPVTDYNGGQRAMALLALTVPNGIRVLTRHSVHVMVRSGIDSGVTAKLASGDSAAVITSELMVVGANLGGNSFFAGGMTNASRQINCSFVLDYGTQAGSHLVKTLGWTDYTVPRI